MGLLDDAICEHLELKRRAGADPDDIARQEREALGPIRSMGAAFPAGGAPEADAPPHDEDEAYDPGLVSGPGAIEAAPEDGGWEPAGPDDALDREPAPRAPGGAYAAGDHH